MVRHLVREPGGERYLLNMQQWQPAKQRDYRDSYRVRDRLYIRLSQRGPDSEHNMSIKPHCGSRRGPGQATVEFALLMVVLFALLYGILEIGRLLFINAELDNAAREGVHYASRHPAAN